jgi:hypothetical protein
MLGVYAYAELFACLQRPFPELFPLREGVENDMVTQFKDFFKLFFPVAGENTWFSLSISS